MSSMTNYLSNHLLDHIAHSVSFASPTGLWLGLYTTETNALGGGTEVPSGGYTRVSLIFGSPVDGIMTNTSDIYFPAATAPWYTVVSYGISDAFSGGNMLFYGKLNVPVFINTGNVYHIPSGSFTLVLK